MLRLKRVITLSLPFVTATALAPLTTIYAQSPSLSQLANGSQAVGSDRDAEFLRLAEDVEAYQRQHSLLRRAVSFAMPSIVHIEAVKESAVDTSLTSSRTESPRRIEEAGAGVMVLLNGKQFAITNRHVIHAASLSAIRIETAQHQRLRPVRVWSDASTDIAVIQLEGDAFVPSRLGDSDSVEAGDPVFAIGSPFGLNHSVTSGILSAKGRRNLDLGNRAIDIQDFFQTDAAINPGNSGGPLFNLKGEVIGINTAIASNSGGNEGIGFSIPINMVMSVTKQLVDNGQLHRAYLGVQMDNQFDETKAHQFGLKHPVGALVKAVRGQSPAEQAGFRYGDIILNFNGVDIQDDGHLVQTVGLSPINKPIKAVVLRQNQRIEVSVILTALPEVY